MITALYKLRSKILVYEGSASWRFLVIPKKQAKEIKTLFGKHSKAWGSIPVTVAVGKTEWKTSLFPDKKKETYLLPLKLAVRETEGITDKDIVSFTLKI